MGGTQWGGCGMKWLWKGIQGPGTGMIFFRVVGKHRRSEVGKNMIWFVEKNKPGREWRAKKWGMVPISWEAVPVGHESDYGYSSGDNSREKWFQKICFSGRVYIFWMAGMWGIWERKIQGLSQSFDICIFTCMSTIYCAGRHGEPNLKREI